ncbi:MAG: hypothetical protein GTO45_10840, partial [Candidatus Aminicenantes bacterium]|nr:hypothetical protein [Candidatus Aminicenantes bacterium]NIM79300.1 hypothetical protein [Candidatus Aminicenantes bacterium]NIN18589.1 hypothetical protein [Candidatus Aminicenantes bacterium]NIN42478.1 hypothetical protein [Candidatus Aminicenantes bacterium]NIN85244.1 hypothetical protein [Candidatus Aminicenantes bacterium]
MTEKKGKTPKNSKSSEKSKRLEIGSLIVALITLIGIIFSVVVNYKNQELTEKIAAKQDEITKIQMVVDYIPYLSIDRKEQRKIAVVALSRILDPETAIRMGIAAGGESEIDEAVEAIGESAIEPLINIANDTKDQKVLELTRNALKKFDREIVILKISSLKYDLLDYRVFRSSEIFVNLRVSKPVHKLWIDWRNGGDEKGQL